MLTQVVGTLYFVRKFIDDIENYSFMCTHFGCYFKLEIKLHNFLLIRNITLSDE